MTSNKKILILEDDHVSLLFVRKILEPIYSITEASNVEICLKEMRDESFDVVLSDFTLPDGSALDLLNYIHQNQIQIPVIILTKFSETKNMSACWQAGAFDFVEKPVKKEHLLEIIAMALAFPPPYHNMNEAFKARIKNQTETEILNFEEVLARFDGDQDLINQVFTVARNALTQFKLFLKSYEGQAMPENKVLSYEFHQIEGATLTISADRFTQCISRLSKAMKRGESLVPSDLSYLEKQLDLLIEKVDEMLLNSQSNLASPAR